ncbi:hypothetical protein EON67_02905 [archaeon]|nr:MAG: hypothetical protein EON67_02905 [archaeon]
MTLRFPGCSARITLGGDPRIAALDERVASLARLGASAEGSAALQSLVREVARAHPLHVRITSPPAHSTPHAFVQYATEPRWDAAAGAMQPPSRVEVEVRAALVEDAEARTRVWQGLAPSRVSTIPVAPAATHRAAYQPDVRHVSQLLAAATRVAPAAAPAAAAV